MFLRGSFRGPVGDFIKHEGRGHDDNPPGPGSGRYRYGSGDNPFQHGKTLKERHAYLKAQHPEWSRSRLASELGCPSTTVMDRELSRETASQKAALAVKIKQLKDTGLSNVEISKQVGVAATTVGNYVNDANKKQGTAVNKAANALRPFVDEHKYVDVSNGTAAAFPGISENALKSAVHKLQKEGYALHKIKFTQPTTGHKTTMFILCTPGTTFGELSEHKYDIKNPLVASRTLDPVGDISSLGIRGKPTSIDPSRIQVAYDSPKDGLIELRRGCPDLSLGRKSVAQVRIAVDDTHYLKGVAVYRDDMPPGIDIVYNSNKKEGTPLLVKYTPENPDPKQVAKQMKMVKDKDGNVTGIDWANPFGATINNESDIMQTSFLYTDKDGKTKQSAINVVHEQGDWDDYSKTVSSQYWSKQPWETAKRQLELMQEDKKVDFETIKSIDNLSVRKHMLIKFADECDRAAVDLKAAPFKGQSACVLLPCNELSDNEVYAPRYPDGTKLALVRYPFAGAFESPLLTVRNTGSPAQKVIPMSVVDAVCVNKSRLNQMSGADCDGDFAMVIPVNSKTGVKTGKDTLPDLKDFDPKEAYPPYDGIVPISNKQKQIEMGKITNLMSDMYFQDPPESEYARAVKFSMVIIDAEKHKLDWKRAYKELRIDELKNTYQLSPDGRKGAGTIITRAKSPKDIPEMRDWRASASSIDVEGNKIPKPTNNLIKEAKVNLKNVTLTDGQKVNLTYDKDEKSLYYLTRDKAEKKNIRHYVTDDDLPENLRGLSIRQGGWIYLNDEKATGREYYFKEDPNTGKSVRVYSKDIIVDTKSRLKTQETTKMADAKDAYELTSGGSKDHPGHAMERVAAEHANFMKQLAREARLEWVRTATPKCDTKASAQYAEEVASLKKKLTDATANAPFEREAVRKANRTIQIKRLERPDMSAEDLKKLRNQAMLAAREQLGHKKQWIKITPKEYEAIRANALTHTDVERILNNTKLETIREYATPKSRKALSDSVKSSIIRLYKAGVYGNEVQLASRFNISPSYVSEIVNGAA